MRRRRAGVDIFVCCFFFLSFSNWNVFVFLVVSMKLCAGSASRVRCLLKLLLCIYCVHWILIFLNSIYAVQSLFNCIESLRVLLFSLAFRFLLNKYHNRPTETSFFVAVFLLIYRSVLLLCIHMVPSFRKPLLARFNRFFFLCIFALFVLPLLSVYCQMQYSVYHLKCKQEKKKIYIFFYCFT